MRPHFPRASNFKHRHPKNCLAFKKIEACLTTGMIKGVKEEVPDHSRLVLYRNQKSQINRGWYSNFFIFAL